MPSRFYWVTVACVLCFISGKAQAICPDTAACIARIRELAAEPRHFWFGEQRHALCENGAGISGGRSSVACWSIPALAPFHSLGQRLFRVRTYHDAYLQNLRVFPRITYRPNAGTYRACDHEFVVDNVTRIEADPDMKAVDPYLIRRKPEVGWHGLQFNDRYVLLLTDVGFGTLNWLVDDFPADPKTIREYQPSENFRPLPNPLALLVFKKPTHKQVKITQSLSSIDDDFDISDFILRHELEDGLVGLGLVVVGGDAFGIERQRLKGGPDNCHSLLYPKLSSPDSSPRALARLPIDELSVWLTVMFPQPRLNARVCCKNVLLREEQIVVDPLGSRLLSAISVISPPLVSALLPPVPLPNANYHRSARTYVALMDELYTLALVDGSSGALHWLRIDIPSTLLASDARSGGKERAAYIVPVGEDPGSCSRYVLALLQQQSSLSLISSFCETQLCHERNTFRLDTFKQRYSLRLAGVTWFTVCYDLPYAYNVLSKSDVNEGMTFLSKYPGSRHNSPSSHICTALKADLNENCDWSHIHAGSISLSKPYVILIISLLGNIVRSISI